LLATGATATAGGLNGKTTMDSETGMIDEPSQPDVPMNTVNVRAAEETSSARDTTDVIIDVIVIFLCGVAIVLAFVAITYLVSKLTDICDRRNRLYDEHDEIDRGGLTRKANLWGLRRSERQQILKRIFQSTTHAYSTKNDDNYNNKKAKGGDIEMEAVSISTTSEMKGEAATNTGQKTKGTSSTPPANNNQNESNNVAEQDMDHGRICCICLAEYQDGESVMTGTRCEHLFHTACCQEWLAQHDHCPYCRKEIVLPSEFRATAVTVLGEQRVQALSMPLDLLVPSGEGDYVATVVAGAEPPVDPRSPTQIARSPTSVAVESADVDNDSNSDDEIQI